MKKILINISIIILLLTSCSTKSEPETELNKETNLIEILDEQYQNENMQIGKIEMTAFDDVVDFNGILTTKSIGNAKISLPIPGIISKIYAQAGSNISAGSTIFTIKGNEVIDIQQAFAESSANFLKYKSDYERVKELYSDKIGSKKELISAEALFRSENARYNALKLKLVNIGINPNNIEGGDFLDHYNVKSPISGHITEISASLGQYMAAGDVLASVINNNSTLLKISIFEKDISKVKINQTVQFYSEKNPDETNFAKIISVGKSKNEDTQTIDCFAEIANSSDVNFPNNSFVNGQVIIKENQYFSLPETAFINDGTNDFIFKIVKKEKGKIIAEKVQVKLGQTYKRRKQILSEVDVKSNYLINGVYNIH